MGRFELVPLPSGEWRIADLVTGKKIIDYPGDRKSAAAMHASELEMEWKASQTKRAVTRRKVQGPR